MATLYIAIYPCSPKDVPHWALFVEEDDDGNSTIHQALGSSGIKFRYDSQEVDMNESESPSELPKIGRVEADVWPEVPDLLKKVPMSAKKGWNCQSWVMAAIAALKKEDYLEEEEAGTVRIKSMYQKNWEEY